MSSLKQKIQESAFIRTDLEIEIEVKNARRNWKRCKKKGTNQVTDEDFRRILTTRRVRVDHVVALLSEATKQGKTMAEICEQVARICEPCELKETVGCEKADCIVNLRRFVPLAVLEGAEQK